MKPFGLNTSLLPPFYPSSLLLLFPSLSLHSNGSLLDILPCLFGLIYSSDLPYQDIIFYSGIVFHYMNLLSFTVLSFIIFNAIKAELFGKKFCPIFGLGFSQYFAMTNNAAFLYMYNICNNIYTCFTYYILYNKYMIHITDIHMYTYICHFAHLKVYLNKH